MKARVRQCSASIVKRGCLVSYVGALPVAVRRRRLVCQAAAVSPPDQIAGLPEFLGNLKYNDQGLVAVIVQVTDAIRDELNCAWLWQPFRTSTGS